jgi:hypothetical protein
MTTTTTENTYISFVENNLKNNTSYICFLQYNGNEEELAKLYTYIKAYHDAEFEAYGEMSSFSMDINTFYTQQTVDQMLKLKIADFAAFYKFNGKFTCPLKYSIIKDFDKEKDEDEYALRIEDLEDLLHEHFYYCGINKYFAYLIN